MIHHFLWMEKCPYLMLEFLLAKSRAFQSKRMRLSSLLQSSFYDLGCEHRFIFIFKELQQRMSAECVEAVEKTTMKLWLSEQEQLVHSHPLTSST